MLPLALKLVSKSWLTLAPAVLGCREMWVEIGPRSPQNGAHTENPNPFSLRFLLIPTRFGKRQYCNIGTGQVCWFNFDSRIVWFTSVKFSIFQKK